MLIPGSEPPPGIAAFARSMFKPSPLSDVATAVAEATRHRRLIYVERLPEGWRWSLAGRGGPYPMLRRTAQFLGVDYTSIVIGFRTIGDGISVVVDPEHAAEPEDWTLIEFDGPTAPDAVEARIRAAFADR